MKNRENCIAGNKITLINMISSMLLQVFTIISGFIIPKLILSYFGSDVNGLVSSINQFLSYITLLEGGISGVITANLYKPLVEKNAEKINSVLKTANDFYRKIGIIFIAYTIILASAYPMLFNTRLPYMYVFTLTIILALSLFIQYMFSLNLKTLLNADKKVYVVSGVQIIIVVFNIILAVISVKIFPSIHILKLITGLLYILQPIIYGMYVKRNYNYNKNVKSNNQLVKERWNGFAINIAYFIHSSTDITILTIFTNLATVSVYSIYALVASGLRQVINSITIGINPSLGQAYAIGNMDELNEKMDLYEYIVFVLVFLLFTVGGLLVTPFVMIYTANITDANYYEPLFGILILVAEAIYLLKFPHLNLAYSANKFKDITKPAFIEAILNIVVSIILVNRLGIIGVAIGTIVAMIYRMMFHIKLTKNLIESRKPRIFYSKLLLFLVTTFIGVLICISIIPQVEYTMISWIIHAIVYTIIMGILYLILSILCFKREIAFFFKYLRY